MSDFLRPPPSSSIELLSRARIRKNHTAGLFQKLPSLSLFTLYCSPAMISKIRIPSHHIPVNLVTWRAGRGRQLLLTPVLPGLALYFLCFFYCTGFYCSQKLVPKLLKVQESWNTWISGRLCLFSFLGHLCLKETTVFVWFFIFIFWFFFFKSF